MTLHLSGTVAVLCQPYVLITAMFLTSSYSIVMGIIEFCKKNFIIFAKTSQSNPTNLFYG